MSILTTPIPKSLLGLVRFRHSMCAVARCFPSRLPTIGFATVVAICWILIYNSFLDDNTSRTVRATSAFSWTRRLTVGVASSSTVAKVIVPEQSNGLDTTCKKAIIF